MTNNLTLAKLIAWTCCLMLAGVLTAASFMFLVDQDRWGPEGITDGFTVVELPPSESRDTVISAIDDAAKHASVNVYKMSPFSRGDTRGTDYHVFSGDASTVMGDLHRGEFPTFTTYYPAVLHPASTLSRDRLLGAYAVQGDSGKTQKIVSELADQGIQATPSRSSPGALLWPFFLASSPWGVATAILSIGLLLAMVNLSSVRLAVVGLRRAAGASHYRVLGPETIAVLYPTVVCAAAMPVTLLAYSALRVDGYRTGSILTVGALQALIPLAAGVCALALVGIASQRISTGRMVSGARPVALVAALSVSAVVITSAGVSVSASSAVARVIDEQSAQSADAYRAHHSELVQPAMGYAIASRDEPRLTDQLGRIYRIMETQGAALLTDSHSFMASDRGSDEVVSPRAMVINTAFLNSLPDRDSALTHKVGDIVRRPGGVAVLVPSRLSGQTEAIRSDVEEWARFHVSLRDPAHRVHPQLTVIHDVNLGVVPRLDYGDVGTPMHVTDPVLVVTDVSGGVLSNEYYGRQGVFTDADAYERLLKEHQATTAVVALRGIDELSALERADRIAELRMILIGTAVMLMALLFGAAVFAAVHHARRRTAVFLLTSTGSGYAGIHGRFTVLTAILALVPAVIGTILVPIPWGFHLAVVAVIVGFTVGMTILALTLLRRGVNRAALEIS